MHESEHLVWNGDTPQTNKAFSLTLFHSGNGVSNVLGEGQVDFQVDRAFLTLAC